MQLIKAVDDIDEDRIRSEQTLNRLMDEGVDCYTRASRSRRRNWPT